MKKSETPNEYANYTSDRWSIVKITNLEGLYPVLYKVFFSFPGSYLGGESWQMNSGIKSYTEYNVEGNRTVDFRGYSGSLYRALGEDLEHSYWASCILKTLSERAGEGWLLQTITYEDFKKEFTNAED